MDCQCGHRASYGKEKGRRGEGGRGGGHLSGCGIMTALSLTHRSSIPEDCHFCLSQPRRGGAAEAKKPLYEEKAVICSCPAGTNGVSVT